MRSSSIAALEPRTYHRLIDLVQAAGLDVSDWSNYKGGAEKASANPKYCYEWCFVDGEKVILNLWFDDIKIESDSISQKKNFRNFDPAESNVRRQRASRIDSVLKYSFDRGLSVRVILLKGDRNKSVSARSAVRFRLLDNMPWVVTSYDKADGSCVIMRGIIDEIPIISIDPELEDFTEGEQRRRFVLHRKREAKLRKLKLAEHAQANGGRLRCEVPNCGFDFAARYGSLGEDYAQVHHKTPLSKAPSEGIKVKLEELAVVCANCHAMIHRGGECRPLDTLIACT